MAREKTRGRFITGALIGVGIGALVYFGTREASAADPEPPPEPPDPGPGPDPLPPPPPPAPNQTTSKVPARGPIPYNQGLFTDTATTAGLLADLSASYGAAVLGPDGLQSAAIKFQNDWNALAVQNALSPSRLNSSRLVPDGTMGHQTLRALEWALFMGGWPA